MGNEELLGNVRRLLKEAMEARFDAAPHDRKVRAQAYLDGYMRALADSNRVGDTELLRLVGEERRRDAQLTR